MIFGTGLGVWDRSRTEPDQDQQKNQTLNRTWTIENNQTSDWSPVTGSAPRNILKPRTGPAPTNFKKYRTDSDRSDRPRALESSSNDWSR